MTTQLVGPSHPSPHPCHGTFQFFGGQNSGSRRGYLGTSLISWEQDCLLLPKGLVSGWGLVPSLSCLVVLVLVYWVAAGELWPYIISMLLPAVPVLALAPTIERKQARENWRVPLSQGMSAAAWLCGGPIFEGDIQYYWFGWQLREKLCIAIYNSVPFFVHVEFQSTNLLFDSLFSKYISFLIHIATDLWSHRLEPWSLP